MRWTLRWDGEKTSPPHPPRLGSGALLTMYRVSRVWAGAALFIAVACVTVTACTSNANSNVKVAAVGYATVAQVVQAPANIVPKSQVTVSAPDDGTVAQLAVQDGQQVKAGQLLGTVSSPAAQQQLAQAKQAAAQASAS